MHHQWVYEFREAIADATNTSRGFKPNIDQVLVTPGETNNFLTIMRNQSRAR